MKTIKEDSNLEKITQAWKMGWSATLKIKQLQDLSIKFINARVRGIKDGMILVYSNNSPIERINFKGGATGKSIEITGYLYAGELAGNEPIPNFQKFKRKPSGNIIYYNSGAFYFEDGDYIKGITEMNKSEIEPIF